MGGNGERHDRDGKKIGCILACRTRERAIDVGKKGGYDFVIGHSGESMSKVLTLQLPEELYNPLLEIAQRWGQSPEEVTLQWLKSSIQQFTEDEASLALIRAVTQKLTIQQIKPQHQLSEFRGIVQHPFLGEDAQTWISRTRQEGNDRREQVLRGQQ